MSGGRRRRPSDAQQQQQPQGWGSWAASGMKKTGQMLGVVAPDKARRTAGEQLGGGPPDVEELEMGEYGGGKAAGGPQDDAIRVFRGHTSSVYGCVFAPGQARFVSGGRDKTLRLWYLTDFGEGRTKELSPHRGFVLTCDFAATKKHIVTGSEDSNVYVYETSEGTVAGTLKGHTNKVYAVAYTPCTSMTPASTIVSASLDRTARLWDADTLQEEAKLSGHTDNVFAAQFSRSGELVATAGDDLRILAWDPRTRKPAFEWTGHQRTIWSVCWNRDDSQLVSCGMGAELKLWDVRQRKELSSAYGCHHGTPTHQAIFADDDRCIITCGRDKKVQVRKNTTGLPLMYELQGHTGTVYHMDLHPDGDQLLTSSVDCSLRMWKLRKEES
eukprot:TRINITY_DN4390_c3_g1_i1.p1 TRINITY_DN4390_c3_g1~~TRINITY_DN4390_c3_g1_i1.p1  ORF type:complete len:385 (+),score=139.63 TRINITY_DN4390_c3_g1_i1:118-1272(+)